MSKYQACLLVGLVLGLIIGGQVGYRSAVRVNGYQMVRAGHYRLSRGRFGKSSNGMVWLYAAVGAGFVFAVLQ